MGPLPCPVLSVCNVGVLRPNVGWIKMLLGTEVGLGPGDIVLDADPAPPPRKGAQHPSPTFRPMSIVSKRSSSQQTAELLFLFRGDLNVLIEPGMSCSSHLYFMFILCLLWANKLIDWLSDWLPVICDRHSIQCRSPAGNMTPVLCTVYTLVNHCCDVDEWSVYCSVDLWSVSKFLVSCPWQW